MAFGIPASGLVDWYVQAGERGRERRRERGREGRKGGRKDKRLKENPKTQISRRHYLPFNTRVPIPLPSTLSHSLSCRFHPLTRTQLPRSAPRRNAHFPPSSPSCLLNLDEGAAGGLFRQHMGPDGGVVRGVAGTGRLLPTAVPRLEAPSVSDGEGRTGEWEGEKKTGRKG